MSDIPDSGSFNLGLANLTAQNYGPNAVASQANTNASTALTQQQTQGAAIANAQQALVLQGRRIGLNMLYNLPGASADQSGDASSAGAASSRGTASSGSASNTSTPSGGGVAPAAPDDQADDDLGESVSHPELLDQSLRQQFQVNHLGTPEEQMNILKAGQISAMTGDPSYVQIMTARRDMAVAQRVYAAQQSAAQHYDEMAAVADAGDKGLAWQTLQAVAPESAKKIAKLHPQEAGESDTDYADRLNELSADTAAHFAAHVHKYSGYETETRSDGVVVDKATGFPVAGVRGSGLSAEQYGKAIDAANAPVTIKNSDGTETQMPTWKYAQSQGMPVTSANDYVQQKAQQQQDIAQHKQMVQNRLTAQRTQQQIAQGVVPSTVQSGAGQPSAQSGAPGQQPGQRSQPKDNGLLPGINPDALPKIQTPTVRPGMSQSPADAETAKGVATSRLEQMKASNDAYTNDQKEGALLKAAQREAAALAANPRMAGPGSEVAQALAKMRTAVTGQAPDSLVDLGGLDKILLQLGAQNVRAALQGQKITQAEFLLMLGKGNPNTEQPLATINKLLGYLGAQNDYDQRFNRTKMTALNRGANPLTVDSDIGAQSDRGDYVESRVGVRPPLAGGQSSGGQQRTIVRTGTLNGRKVVQYSDGSTGYAE
jgi:hypothetical protein